MRHRFWAAVLFMFFDLLSQVCFMGIETYGMVAGWFAQVFLFGAIAVLANVLHRSFGLSGIILFVPSFLEQLDLALVVAALFVLCTAAAFLAGAMFPRLREFGSSTISYSSEGDPNLAIGRQ